MGDIVWIVWIEHVIYLREQVWDGRIKKKRRTHTYTFKPCENPTGREGDRMRKRRKKKEEDAISDYVYQCGLSTMSFLFHSLYMCLYVLALSGCRE